MRWLEPARATQSPAALVDPALQDGGELGRGGGQVGQLIDDDGTGEAGLLRFAGQARQEAVPVGVIHLVEPGEFLGDAVGHVLALNGGGGFVADKIEAVLAAGPFEEEARFPDAAAPPDDGQAAGFRGRQAKELLQLGLTIDKLHENIMFWNIINNIFS
jgi:hypothetical protein